MRRTIISSLVGLAACLGAAGDSKANQPKSLYTTLELKDCTVLRRHVDGNAYLCPGLGGAQVYYATGDLRAFVSAGAAPDKRKAAGQTLRPFNSVFKGKTTRTTIEWRIASRGGKVVPHATIVRYFTSRDQRKGEVLVVSRVTERETCHVAYIDALANPDAIAIARRIADKVAPTFECAREPSVEGTGGKSPI